MKDDLYLEKKLRKIAFYFLIISGILILLGTLILGEIEAVIFWAISFTLILLIFSKTRKFIYRNIQKIVGENLWGKLIRKFSDAENGLSEKTKIVERRFCDKLQKIVEFSFNDGILQCQSSFPIKSNKDKCTQSCVHNIVTQAVSAEIRDQNQISDTALHDALGPVNYKDWAPSSLDRKKNLNIVKKVEPNEYTYEPPSKISRVKKSWDIKPLPLEDKRGNTTSQKIKQERIYIRKLTVH